MTVKRKINASEVQTGDRIIVAPSIADGRVNISRTKTGEGVHVARVVSKVYLTGSHRRPGEYIVTTTSGSFGAAPIETMWLAPEDALGIKRAHAKALAEDAHRAAQIAQAEMDEATENQATPQYRHFAEVTRTAGGYRNAMDALHAEAHADPRQWATEGTEYPYRGDAQDIETLPDPDGSNTLPIPAGPWFDPEAGASAPDANRHPSQTGGAEDLTLNSHAGKVVHMNNDAAPTTELGPIDKAAILAKPIDSLMNSGAREATGSAVVRLLEKVWARIRKDHPELPDVVIVTGAGLRGDNKWGHFRADGWKVREEGAAVSASMHEMFMAGETLAKGAKQVLQTMLHEGAHTLCRVRKIQDTSRQGRWHNKDFRKAAEEMGLQHKASVADKGHGYAFVTLTDDTLARYADILADLDQEIRLVVSLPVWMGGSAEEDETDGGEQIGKKPRGEAKTNGSNVKATCGCLEPNIIRLSKKVLALEVVRCDECGDLFEDRG